MADYIIYFSPTGGTKRVADILATEIMERITDVDLCVREDALSLPTLTEEDVCIIAAPSFGGRVPGVNAERIRRLSGGGAKAILLCVYGNREYDDTLAELYNEAVNAGFRCVAAVCAIAEHSIVRQFASKRPDSDDERILQSFAVQIKEKLERKDFEIRSPIPGSFRNPRERGKSNAKPAVNDSCTLCADCARGCPTGAIDFENPKNTDGEKCISCMKCVAICPQKARALDESVLSAIKERLSKVCTQRKNNELFL